MNQRKESQSHPENLAVVLHEYIKSLESISEFYCSLFGGKKDNVGIMVLINFLLVLV